VLTRDFVGGRNRIFNLHLGADDCFSISGSQANLTSFFFNMYVRRAFAMAMVAYIGMSFRRGATVTAFSFATLSTRSATASAARFGASAFAPKQAYSRYFASSTHLKAATAGTCSDLEKALDVTHPAYDGAYQLRMIYYVMFILFYF
jgi:hypothetical protein